MTLADQNKQRWMDMIIPNDNGPAFKATADRLTSLDAQNRYKAVSAKTGVPWQVIAVIHEREGAQNWGTYLGNGQSLKKKTTIVPKGRGPFSTWEEGAIDALVNCAPYASKNTDWSVGGTLALLEKYNGLGYASKGLPSPYIWAGTNQYSAGKYVSDGVFKADVIDKQLGCAGILRFMNWGKPLSGGTIAAGGVVAAGAGAAVSAPHHYMPWIIGGTFVTALIAFLVFDIISYRNWKKSAPVV